MAASVHIFVLGMASLKGLVQPCMWVGPVGVELYRGAFG